MRIHRSAARLPLLMMLMAAVTAQAREPSNTALFRRCYGLITQSYAEPSHPLMAQVKAGTVDPITACLQVLDRAKLGTDGKVMTNDAESRKVLNTFHSLHYSWFSVRDFDTSQPGSVRDSTRDLYDISSPALYFTKALFDGKMSFKEIFLGTTTLGSVRTTMSPATGIFSGVSVNNYVYKGATMQNAGGGDLLGVRSIAPVAVTPGSRAQSTYGPTLTLYRHFGGGVLGSSPYITFSVRQESGKRSNAGVTMPRKWSMAVAKDFMCRELPLIRTVDAQKYVSNTAEISFRQVSTCVRCHASIDQMAGTIRQVGLTSYESGYASPVATRVLSASVAAVHQNLNQTAEMAWPTSTDANYYRRPATGRLVLRTFDGKLVDTAVKDVGELGQKISELDDPYVCAALRYWEYFVGVHIRMADNADPEIDQTLSPAEQKNFDEIVKLGRDMKQHQSARRMLEALLRSPAFKDAAAFSGAPP